MLVTNIITIFTYKLNSDKNTGEVVIRMILRKEKEKNT